MKFSCLYDRGNRFPSHGRRTGEVEHGSHSPTPLIPATYALSDFGASFPPASCPRSRAALGGILSFVVTAWSNASCRWRCNGARRPRCSFGGLGTLAAPSLLSSYRLAHLLAAPTEHNVTFIWRWVHQLITAPNGSTSPAPATFTVRHRHHRLAHDPDSGRTRRYPRRSGAGALHWFCVRMFQHLNIRTPALARLHDSAPEGLRCTRVRGFTAYNPTPATSRLRLLLAAPPQPRGFHPGTDFGDGASALVGHVDRSRCGPAAVCNGSNLPRSAFTAAPQLELRSLKGRHSGWTTGGDGRWRGSAIPDPFVSACTS